MDGPDLFEALERRNRAFDELDASQVPWIDFSLDKLLELPVGTEGTGEDFRAMLLDMGVATPHPNAWGALIATARRRGLLYKTGEYRKMRQPKSHARETPVYRVTHG